MQLRSLNTLSVFIFVFLFSCSKATKLDEEQILEIIVPKIFSNHKLVGVKHISSQKFKNIDLPYDYYFVELDKKKNSVVSYYLFYEGNLFQIGKSLNCILLKQEVFVTPKNKLITNIQEYAHSIKDIKKLKAYNRLENRTFEKDESFYRAIDLTNLFCD